MKNKYITKEEFNMMVDKLNERNRHFTKEVCYLIFSKGMKVRESFLKVNPMVSLRTIQRQVLKASNNEITLYDLRKGYLLNNPHLIFKPRKKSQHPIRVKIRWEVFERDNFRCVACGLTSKETILNVDHIYPKSKGGKDNLNNLQTLCALCNLGKRDRVIQIKLKHN